MQEKIVVAKETINEDPHKLAQAAKIKGEKYMQRGKTGLAKEAFSLAIRHTCSIVPGTKENCVELSRYLRLVAKTYSSKNYSYNAELLRLTADIIIYAYDINVSNLYNHLARLIAPSSGIDERLLSNVILPVLKFIDSNHPDFQNPYLHKLVDGFLTYFTDFQNNPQLLTLLAFTCEQRHKYDDISTTLEHVLIKQKERIEFLKRGLNQRGIIDLLKELKEKEETRKWQEFFIEKQREKIKKLLPESEINTPAKAAIEYQEMVEEPWEKIERIITQLLPESEIKRPVRAAEISNLYPHELENSFPTYCTHSQDNPQLLELLSSDLKQKHNDRDRIKALGYYVLIAQEKIEHLERGLTQRRRLMNELKELRDIIEGNVITIRRLSKAIVKLKQEKAARAASGVEVIEQLPSAAPEQLPEVTEPLPGAASEQKDSSPKREISVPPYSSHKREVEETRAASVPASHKRKERSPSSTDFFGPGASREGTPAPLSKKMRSSSSREVTPFSLPSPQVFSGSPTAASRPGRG